MGIRIENLRWVFEKRPETKLLPSIKLPGETDWRGGDGYFYKEWTSPDGKHSISKTVSFGPKFGNMHSENIELLRADQPMILGKTSLMRVLAVLEPGSTQPKYHIYLDAIQEDTKSCMFKYAAYYEDNNGKLSEPSSWSDPNRRTEYVGLTESEFRKMFIQEAKTLGIHHESELLPEINTRETALLFLSKLQLKDFSKPVLVPKS